MKYSLLMVVAAGLAAVFEGCVEPEMLYRSTPVAKNTVWVSGKEFVTESRDSITVSIAFENELEGTNTFYVVVGNLGSDTVVVSPEQIHSVGKGERLDPVTDYESGYVSFDTVTSIDTFFAVNPEKALEGIDRQMAQANATYATQTGLNTAAALLQLVGDVATIGQNKTREQLYEEDRNRREIAESQTQNNVDYSLQSASLSDQRAYWESATLRKTTLFPGSAVGGKVRIPVDQGARTLKVFIPIGSTMFDFTFDQRPVPAR